MTRPRHRLHSFDDALGWTALLLWATFRWKWADKAKAAELLEKLGLPRPAPAEQWA